jgi:hypothetical protein
VHHLEMPWRGTIWPSNFDYERLSSSDPKRHQWLHQPVDPFWQHVELPGKTS